VKIKAPFVQDAFHVELRRRVKDIIAEHTAVLASGMPASMEDYRRHTGHIAALRSVLELCTEIEQRLYATNPRQDAAQAEPQHGD
jgi:hypothetical protein